MLSTILTIIAVVALLLSIATLIAVFGIKFDANHVGYKNSWHYKMYEFLSFSGMHYKAVRTPLTICTYYWNVIMKIWIFPLTLPILLFGLIVPKYKDADNLKLLTTTFWSYNILSIMWGWIFYSESGVEFTTPWYLVWLVGLGIFTAFLLFWILIVATCNAIKEYRNKKQNARLNYKYSDKGKSILLLRIKSWKDKNCPMIHWR